MKFIVDFIPFVEKLECVIKKCILVMNHMEKGAHLIMKIPVLGVQLVELV